MAIDIMNIEPSVISRDLRGKFVMLYSSPKAGVLPVQYGEIAGTLCKLIILNFISNNKMARSNV